MQTPEQPAKYPDLPIVSMTTSRRWDLVRGDLDDDEKVSDLIGLLYEQEENHVFYYCQEGTQWDAPLQCAVENRLVRVLQTKGFHYPHPAGPRSFIFLPPPDHADPQAQKIIEQGRQYWQHELKLTSAARRELEVQQTVAAQKAANSNPIKLEPNFMGIGIDLRKAYSWLTARLKNTP